jgi:hypothetical protein
MLETLVIVIVAIGVGILIGLALRGRVRPGWQASVASVGAAAVTALLIHLAL